LLRICPPVPHLPLSSRYLDPNNLRFYGHFCIFARTIWADHVGAIIRVSRTTHRRDATTGLWDTSSEVAYFVCEFLLPAALCAQAIRHHWAIENRSHYVRDGSFREDARRIRCVENVSDTRYRITLGGLNALRSLHFM
jgi:predicted transposase YbfD/YdcC